MTSPTPEQNEDEHNQAAPVTLVQVSQLVFLDRKKLRFFTHGATLWLTVEDDRS